MKTNNGIEEIKNELIKQERILQNFLKICKDVNHPLSKKFIDTRKRIIDNLKKYLND